MAQSRARARPAGKTIVGKVRPIAHQPTVPVLPDGVPELYIDGIYGMLVANQAVKLNLTTLRPTPGPQPDNVLVARLTMQIPTFLLLVEALQKTVEQLKKDGVVAESAE